ncbi:MAG: hypothetical protein QNK20_00125, partial [Aureibaculum sp.]|nr:hypothetical protein [Aureibaculum sp.]
GKVISQIGPGKSKGINIVNWNYSIKRPKIAKGKTYTGGGFATPNVEAGTYKAVLTKGKNTYEQNLEVIYDPKSHLTKEGRAFKHKTTMKMYDMMQELAYMVYELDGILVKAEELKNKKLISSLNGLKETLVITTGDNYVGSAESQLREKMAGLYSKIAGSFDKPSNAELENLSIIEERFEKAIKEYSKIKKKVRFLEELKLKTFEEFIK